MKRSKRLYAMLGLLLVICVATALVMRSEDKKEQIKTSGEIVLEVPSDDVQSLSWEYGDTSLSFHKDGTWLYDGDENFPVSEDKINELLGQFEAFGAAFTIEDVSDPGVYGLKDPVCTIRFETAEESYEIQLGDFSKMDEERYVSIGDGNVYLAKVDPLDAFNVELKDMIQNDEALSYDQVSQIRFQGSEDYTVTYEKASDSAWYGDDVYFTEKSGRALPLDTSRVTSYLSDLRYLGLDNYVTYNVTDEELASYGLDDPELTVTVDYTEKDDKGKETTGTYVLSVSRDAEKLAAAQEAEARDEEAEEVTGYARVGDSQIVYELSGDDCEDLLAFTWNDLRHREVLPADFDQVTQLDISLEGEDYTITADGKGDDRTWTYQDQEIEIDDLQDALESLSAGDAEDFLTEKATGKEEISLTVHLDDEARPEAVIRLCRYDGSHCLAVVDGATFALVSRSDAVKLIEAVNAIVLN